MNQLLIEEYIANMKHLGVPVFDVRSEGEFEQGHIPGSITFPLLNNEERHIVGITYKEKGNEEAVLRGFELVGHKFASYIVKAGKLAPNKEVYVYCWRGGLRSNIMAWLLETAGFKVTLLQGGYKTYRNFCLQLFSLKRNYLILSGMTGSGKTEILHSLKQEGEEIVDLEGLAHHRGSSFGALGQLPQPTQEHFENQIGWTLHDLKAGKIIWVEDESRFIGKVRVPDVLFDALKSSPHLVLERSVEDRIQRIINDYGHFTIEELTERTIALNKRMGGDQVKVAVEALQAGNLKTWVSFLLKYYDGGYLHSLNLKTHIARAHFEVRSDDEQMIRGIIDLANWPTAFILPQASTND